MDVTGIGLAALGGALIGLASAGMMLFNGRIAGISGILGGMFSTNRAELSWRGFFIGGLIVGGALLLAIYPEAFPSGEGDRSLGALAIAGLLVGFGTRMGSGCTSGHGVCGISRLSPRSILATAMFMFTGMATVAVVRHLLGGMV